MGAASCQSEYLCSLSRWTLEGGGHTWTGKLDTIHAVSPELLSQASCCFFSFPLTSATWEKQSRSLASMTGAQGRGCSISHHRKQCDGGSPRALSHENSTLQQAFKLVTPIPSLHHYIHMNSACLPSETQLGDGKQTLTLDSPLWGRRAPAHPSRQELSIKLLLPDPHLAFHHEELSGLNILPHWGFSFSSL